MMLGFKFEVTRFNRNKLLWVPVGLSRTMWRLEHRLFMGMGEISLREPHRPFGPRMPVGEGLRVLQRHLRKRGDGFKQIVAYTGLDWDVTIVKKKQKPPPVPDTSGTDGIDKIYAAVHAEFDEKYGIINMGICADKPGEHGPCNAWDIGVSKPKSAAAIHAAILDIADFLRREGIKYFGSEPGGLPVNGIIVMSQICGPMSYSQVWRYYSGTPHVSHVHVSAHPPRAGSI